MKQAIVIFHNGKPVRVCEIKTYPDSAEFLKIKQECEKNLAEEQAKTDAKEKALNEKIAALEKRIILLDAKIKLDNGEIEEKEYAELYEQCK